MGALCVCSYEAVLPHAVDEDCLLSIQLLSTPMSDGLEILICLEGLLLPKSIQDPVAGKNDNFNFQDHLKHSSQERDNYATHR